uniref:Immunoglobulin V-set domain-containing protein n=1 Tax=Seriola dumerili TaxID=41447 RepID=A0A3B4UK50_SERDU
LNAFKSSAEVAKTSSFNVKCVSFLVTTLLRSLKREYCFKTDLKKCEKLPHRCFHLLWLISQQVEVWWSNAGNYVRLSNKLSPDGNRVTYNMSEESNFTLTISDLRESDEHVYCCREHTDKPERCWSGGTKLQVAGTLSVSYSL